MYDHSFRLDKPDREEREYLQFAYGWADVEPKPLSEAAKRRRRFSDGALRLWRQRDRLIDDWLDGKLEEFDRGMIAELEAAADILNRLATDELQIAILKCHTNSIQPISPLVTTFREEYANG